MLTGTTNSKNRVATCRARRVFHQRCLHDRCLAISETLRPSEHAPKRSTLQYKECVVPVSVLVRAWHCLGRQGRIKELELRHNVGKVAFELGCDASQVCKALFATEFLRLFFGQQAVIEQRVNRTFAHVSKNVAELLVYGAFEVWKECTGERHYSCTVWVCWLYGVLLNVFFLLLGLFIPAYFGSESISEHKLGQLNRGCSRTFLPASALSS